MGTPVSFSSGYAKTVALPPAVFGTAAVASGDAISESVDLNGYSLVGVITPAASFVAGALGIQVSVDNLTFVPLYNASGAVASPSLDTSSAWAVNPQDTAGWRYIKITLGTQTANVDLTVIYRPV